jgi:nucleoid-associated protein YgaU
MDPVRRARALSKVFQWMQSQPYIQLADLHMLQDADEPDECCWGLVGPAPGFAPHEPAYSFFGSIAVSGWEPLPRAHPERTPAPVVARLAAEADIAPAAEPATEPAPAPTTETANEPTIYYVAAGDSLRSIAEQVYGDQDAWSSIYEANRGLIGPDPDALVAGAALRLPAVR